MAFDEDLAERVREALAARDAGWVDERKMFGGLAFLVNGHMVVGIVGEELMVRLGPEATVDALKREHVREMDFTGRPAKGAVFVQPAGLEGDALDQWIREAASYNSTLPPKAAAPKPGRGRLA